MGHGVCVRGVRVCAVCVMGFAGWAGVAGAGDAIASSQANHFVRLSPEALTEALAQGVREASTIDYGSFVWMELTPEEFARLAGTAVRFEERRDAFALRLGEVSFDPITNAPNLPSGWDQVRADTADLHLVQFAGPARAQWLAGLKAQGLKVVQYIHPFTYVVWGEMASRNSVAGTPAVRWTGGFAPAYRVQPRWRQLNGEAYQIDILLYRGADTDAAVAALRALGGTIQGRAVMDDVLEEVALTLPGASFQAAAQIPGVYTIQLEPTDGGLRGEMSDQVNVNNVDGTNLAFPGYLTWLSGVGIDGAGVTIANVDGGADQNHADLVNRFLLCSGITCGGGATSSHGTHTSGIMAADGSSGTLDSFGFLRGLGQAPGAHLVEQLYSPFFTQPGGMLLIMTDSFNNGASLSGNSWGPAGTPQGYDDDTRQVDVGVRDADPNAPGNQPLSFVLSIMNGNGGTSSQGTPDEAKNLFGIGSTKMQTNAGAQILQIDDISSNSAHGPALDGRKLPDMVAPGCSVDSTVPGGHAVSGFCGTSMASPHVSGAVALFIQYYRSLPNFTVDPSPALIKAAFTAVARDLAGHTDADGLTLGHPFDSKQGWGRMDVEAVIDPSVAVRYFDNPVVFDNTGEEWIQSATPLDPAAPMRLMLVWTDAPGHGLGGSTPAWNNNLDLVVEAGANTYLGNNFGPSGWSVPGGVSDGMNNTEGVFLGPTSPGAITIRVIAGNISSDGIPNAGDGTDQDFALVCYNCALEPGFSLAATPGARTICAPDDAIYDIQVSQILGFTDPVTLGTTGEPVGTSASFSVNPVTPPGTSTMTVTGTGAAAPGTYSITVDGTTATLTRSTSVDLSLSTAPAGDVTLISPPNSAVDVAPQPTLVWTAAMQATEYSLEIATDSGFADIVESAGGLAETSYTTVVTLDTLSTYYWRARAANACGVGNDSAIFSFTTLDIPPILLVDDDDNSPDVRSTYTSALDALGMSYDIWDTNNSDNEPDAATLSPYQVVIWFTGDEFGGTAGPGPSGESALGAYLDSGRSLFLSSQDYFFDRGTTGFMTTYLGMASATSDVGQTTVTGAGSVFAGMGPYTLSYPFSNFSDVISPDGTAELAFSGNSGDAAINKNGGTYRTTFWGFPWEAVASPADREALMGIVLGWFGQATFADCNNNGVDDLMDILSGTSTDCNGNQIPDECELADGSAQDCNGNSTLDKCDTSSGTSPDGNANGIPDECEMEPPIVVAEGARYVAVTPQGGLSQEPVALLVTGDPQDPTVSCVSLYVQGGVNAGSLDTIPVFQTPAAWGTVHVYGEAVMPDTLYSVQAELAAGFLSGGASDATWLWGDVLNDGDTGFLDVLEMVHGFKENFSVATLEAMDQEPCIPDQDVDFLDMLDGVHAFKDRPYSFKACPAACP